MNGVSIAARRACPTGAITLQLPVIPARRCRREGAGSSGRGSGLIRTNESPGAPRTKSERRVPRNRRRGMGCPVGSSARPDQNPSMTGKRPGGSTARGPTTDRSAGRWGADRSWCVPGGGAGGCRPTVWWAAMVQGLIAKRRLIHETAYPSGQRRSCLLACGAACR